MPAANVWLVSVFGAMLTSALLLSSGCDDRAHSDEFDFGEVEEVKSEDFVGPNNDADDVSDSASDSSCMVEPAAEFVEWLPTQVGGATGRLDRTQRLFPDAASFRNFIGVDPPISIAFPYEWALIFEGGRWYETGLTLKGLELCEATGEWLSRLKAVSTSAGAGCTSPPELSLRDLVLVKFPAPAEVLLFDRDRPMSYPNIVAEETVDCDATSAGIGEECTRVFEPCRPGLYCAGLTRAQRGVCVPSSQLYQVANNDAASIPDGDPNGVLTTNQFAGTVGVDADVLVIVNIDHPNRSELSITLTNPHGQTVSVWDRDSGGGANVLRAPLGFVGEAVDGEWNLHVIDHVVGNAGEVDSWSLVVLTREP